MVDITDNCLGYSIFIKKDREGQWQINMSTAKMGVLIYEDGNIKRPQSKVNIYKFVLNAFEKEENKQSLLNFFCIKDEKDLVYEKEKIKRMINDLTKGR